MFYGNVENEAARFKVFPGSVMSNEPISMISTEYNVPVPQAEAIHIRNMALVTRNDWVAACCNSQSDALCEVICYHQNYLAQAVEEFIIYSLKLPHQSAASIIVT